MTITPEQDIQDVRDIIQDLREQIEDLKQEIAELLEDIDRHAHEQLSAQAVTNAGWYRAEVISYENRRFGTRIELDVDMGPGEAALNVRPGTFWVLSGAHMTDFADLEAKI